MKLVTTKPVAKRAIAPLFFVHSTLRNFILLSHLLRTPYLPRCALNAFFYLVLPDANRSGPVLIMMRSIPPLSAETSPTLPRLPARSLAQLVMIPVHRMGF